MKIAVFGATGRTGRIVVAQALAGGHKVTVLARNPETLALAHRKLKAFKGDVRDFGAVERTIHGTTAVIVALGHRGPRSGSSISAGMGNIIMAMERSGASRVVSLAAAGIMNEAGPIGWIFNILLHSSMKDHRRALELLRESSLAWTVVRPILLTNGPKTGRYRTANDGIPKQGLFISRADVAHFMLRILPQKKHVRKSPSIAK
jgi:putative NADH-flavin reductase